MASVFCAEFTVSTGDADQVLKNRLAGLKKKTDDFRDAWPDIAKLWYAHERAWFASSGEGTWKALKPATVKEKKRQGSPRPNMPLIRTGQLMASATSPIGPYSRYHTTDTSVEFEIAWAPAVYHQLGMGHNPRRPIFAPTPKLITQMGDVLRARIFGVA